MDDKKTLITIIVLLAIFLPAAVVGTYRSSTRADDGPVIEDDNPNHELLFNNKVYFYYNDQLLGTYDCSDCTATSTVIDDTAFHTNYYKNGDRDFPTVLNSAVAIIHQNNLDYVYSIALGRTISNFNALKDYNVEHTSPILIAKSGNFWGVVSITAEAIVPVIDYRYDYISLPAHLIEGKLDTSKFIAKSNDLWYIINDDGTSDYMAMRSEVVDFNDNYYVAFDDSYHVYDYNNQEYLSTVAKDEVYATSEYILVLSESTLSVYQDCQAAALQSITLPSYTSIVFNQTEAGVEIILDGNLYQTIEEA